MPGDGVGLGLALASACALGRGGAVRDPGMMGWAEGEELGPGVAGEEELFHPRRPAPFEVVGCGGGGRVVPEGDLPRVSSAGRGVTGEGGGGECVTDRGV